jgi:hypothetical protein
LFIWFARVALGARPGRTSFELFCFGPYRPSTGCIHYMLDNVPALTSSAKSRSRFIIRA